MDVLRYWLVRTAAFLALWGVLYVVGLRDLLTFVAAAIAAWVLTYIFLPGMRKAAAAQMEKWMDRSERQQRVDAAAEDAEIASKGSSET